MKFKFYILVLFAFHQYILFAQDFTLGTESIQGDIKTHNSPFSMSVELSSRYIWRGMEYGDAPMGLSTLSFTTGQFSAWAMGAYAVNGSHQEVDLGVTYTIKNVTFGISDYYYPSEAGKSDNFFDTNNHTTGHWGEFYANYSPIGKLPLWITVSCYFYGADKKPSDGKQAYSSYAEIGYAYEFKDQGTISLALGASLNKGFYTDYTKGFSVVNIDLSYAKTFDIKGHSLIALCDYIINPAKEKSFVKFSLAYSL